VEDEGIVRFKSNEWAIEKTIASKNLGLFLHLHEAANGHPSCHRHCTIVRPQARDNMSSNYLLYSFGA